MIKDAEVNRRIEQIADEGPPLDRAETLEELNGWANDGKSMDPILVAVSTIYWLGQKAARTEDDWSLIKQLAFWTANDAPELPDELAEEALHLLQSACGAG